MRTVRLLLPLLLTLSLLTSTARAHGPSSKDALNFVEQELITAEFSLFRGVVLSRGGKELDLGFFGHKYDIVFRGSPKAIALGKAYMDFKISGAVLATAGIATLLADVILLAADAKAVIDKGRTGVRSVKPLAWILLGVGAAVGLTGSILIGLSNSRLFSAVRAYNQDVFEQSRRRFSFGITPLPNGVAGHLAYSF
ncbi:MAG: hypothetical protein KC609_07285 [Myxococcales bacterium]|nr:hypothetical protein [Myxococcales bacterium]